MRAKVMEYVPLAPTETEKEYEAQSDFNDMMN